MTTVADGGLPAACVFDAYGTLFDVAGPVERRAATLGDHAARLVTLWRDKQLQYTWLRSLEGRYVDFERVTADALDFALESLGLDDCALRDDLLRQYHALPAFADVKPALSHLRAAGIRALILSNGSPAMLQSAVTAAGLAPYFDDILSVDSVRVFKTDPRVYRLAVDAIGVEAGRIAFVSANGWDACAGAAFGFRSFWCNRSGQPRERLPGRPEGEVRSLASLADVLDVNRRKAPSR